MAIEIKLSALMAARKISLNELAARVGITNVNMSRIKNSKVKSIRFSTLEALCKVLDCQPGELLGHVAAGQGDARESRNSNGNNDRYGRGGKI